MNDEKLAELINKARVDCYSLGNDEWLIMRLPREAARSGEARAMRDTIASLPGKWRAHILVWVDFDLSTMTRDELLDLKGTIEAALGEVK